MCVHAYVLWRWRTVEGPCEGCFGFGKALLASGGSLHYFPSSPAISKSPKPAPVQERFSLTPRGGFDCVHVRCACMRMFCGVGGPWKGRGRVGGHGAGRRPLRQIWCCSPILCGWCTVCWGGVVGAAGAVEVHSFIKSKKLRPSPHDLLSCFPSIWRRTKGGPTPGGAFLRYGEGQRAPTPRGS
jgi:hypothetical protein